MDAKKVENVKGDEDERVDLGVGGGDVTFVKIPHGFIRLPSWGWLKSYEDRAVGAAFSDAVVASFPIAACVAGKSKEIPMQLANDVWREFNIFLTFVNDAKHVAVTSDLSFGAVIAARLRAFDQPFKHRAWDCDALKPIGRFSALDERDLPQILKNIGRAFLKEILLSLSFANRADGRDKIVRQSQAIKNRRNQRRHVSSLFRRVTGSPVWPYARQYGQAS
ncbi:hypothetical protein GCM10008171_19050 [Methylopila jiangsuensis]|uniref:Uncharacterized protein n=1 Tax=Methylopila jiangsuensis TaxID=586230 RepID=A0A9W6JFJ5_9HYPH|nr:hypothetical protein GCM10008171_19050 [Methylopila jiangsuensis]